MRVFVTGATATQALKVFERTAMYFSSCRGKRLGCFLPGLIADLDRPSYFAESSLSSSLR